MAENLAGRVEERLQVILTDRQEDRQDSGEDIDPNHRYPGEEREGEEGEEPQRGYPGDGRAPPYQRYPVVEEDREESYLRPHQRYPDQEEEEEAERRIPPQLSYQFQFEEREQQQQNLEELEHEVNTQEGMNVNLNCVAIGSLPEDAVADWSRLDGKEIDSRHKGGPWQTLRGGCNRMDIYFRL